jgi:hypothetical protein
MRTSVSEHAGQTGIEFPVAASRINITSQRIRFHQRNHLEPVEVA